MQGLLCYGHSSSSDIFQTSPALSLSSSALCLEFLALPISARSSRPSACGWRLREQPEEGWVLTPHAWYGGPISASLSPEAQRQTRPLFPKKKNIVSVLGWFQASKPPHIYSTPEARQEARVLSWWGLGGQRKEQVPRAGLGGGPQLTWSSGLQGRRTGRRSEAISP